MGGGNLIVHKKRRNYSSSFSSYVFMVRSALTPKEVTKTIAANNLSPVELVVRLELTKPVDYKSTALPIAPYQRIFHFYD